MHGDHDGPDRGWDHGRIETRTATVSTDIAWLQKPHKWPGLTAIGMVTRIRELTGRCMRETAYYLLSAPLSAERLNAVVRSHWAVENRLHWRLDVIMNEDQQRMHADERGCSWLSRRSGRRPG